MYNILIVLSKRRLYLYKDDKALESYMIAIGKPSTPTITGKFSVIQKLKNPGGHFGSRWIRVYKGYGIHGTDNPSCIGKNISNGCIRMLNKDIEALYNKIKIGTPVKIIY